MIRQDTDTGFTVVELLITLFIAAAFLVSGYQLYNLIIKDGGQTRSESRASNVAYDYLRRYSTTVATTCTVASTPLNNAAISVTGLSNVRVTVALTCPYVATSPSLTKVNVTVTYNTPLKTVKYATYVNK